MLPKDCSTEMAVRGTEAQHAVGQGLWMLLPRREGAWDQVEALVMCHLMKCVKYLQ